MVYLSNVNAVCEIKFFGIYFIFWNFTGIFDMHGSHLNSCIIKNREQQKELSEEHLNVKNKKKVYAYTGGQKRRKLVYH